MYFGDAQMDEEKETETKKTPTKLECLGKTTPSQVSLISFAVSEEPGGDDQCLTLITVQAAWME